MQTYALPWRRTVSVTLYLALSAVTQQLFCADVPVKHVILYKHGIGYFEREGVVAAGEDARLDFKATAMNDVLKSLTVIDTAGGRIAAIRYDSNETLQQQLEKYRFKIGDREFLSSFLDRIKGSRVELKLADRPVTGAILGARAIEAGPETDKRILREQVTLLLDSGDVANYDLTAATSIRLLDARLQEQLKQYLQTLAQAKSREKRTIYIDSAGSGERNLRISYISPTAIWKSSYRLTLHDAGSTLEGWAIVDNTTDDDWNGVRLSVVSGRPISFISLLDTPRYGKREIAELPEDRAAGPVVYGGSVDQVVTNAVMAPDGTGSGGGRGSGVFAGNRFSVTDGTHLGTGNAPLPAIKYANPQTESQAEISTVEGATGATLGELFEYNFAGPVTIKKNQSAMLPFLQDKISARKLLIFTDQDSEHPVNAAEVTNNTPNTLDGGPITVYDGGAYAGEALVETVKAGDKRLIGYAVDYGTRITTAFDTGKRTVRDIHAKNGTLELRFGEHQTKTYTIRNVDAKTKTLIIQQEGISQYSVLSPKPTERTATAYRFEVKVPANGAQALKVEEERTYENTTAVVSSTPDFLLTIVQNRELSEPGRKQLQAVVDLKTRLSEATSDLNLATSQHERADGGPNPPARKHRQPEPRERPGRSGPQVFKPTRRQRDATGQAARSKA